MDALPSFSDQLNAVPRLSVANGERDRQACKICSGPAEPFDVVDFNKFCSSTDYYAFGLSGIPVCYLRCLACGFMYTRFFDAWRPEDFARWIYNADYILVDGEYEHIRPTHFAEEVAGRLRGLESIAILDYGSGAGVFSEQMRLRGFTNTRNFDPFSAPSRPNGLFDLVTCFEVLEHSPNPVAILQDMQTFLRPGGGILFSQSLQPANIREIRANWWYAAPRNGHVSLYTAGALAHLAQRTGLVLCGREGLFLFRSTSSTPVVDRLFQDVGPALSFRRLHAPGAEPQNGSDSQWHAVERAPKGLFRWSARAVLTWPLDPLPCYPCHLEVSIPFLMVAYSEVLEGATLHAGDQSCKVTVSEGEILARIIVVDPDVRALILRTREPLSPAAIRGGRDQRPLGIAVLGDSRNVPI